MRRGKTGRPSLLVIAGPTAVGKTPAAVALAEQISGEIVCADSRTVYRGMDIGTAKPAEAERKRVPHHLLDIAWPDQVVTLTMYQRLAAEAIDAIRGRGGVPILVGGTGLYIRAIVDGLRIPPTPPDWTFRATLEAAERSGGPGILHRRLREVDPGAAARIHPHNLRRIIRALEVHAHTGEPISVLQRGALAAPAGLASAEESVTMIALAADRVKLYERIDRRVDRHLAAGLVDEVRGLLAAGYSRTLPALQALGYKEIVPHLEGRVSLDGTRVALQRNTRRYAKRQLTWFRHDARYRWLDVGDDAPEVIAGRIRAILRDPPEAPHSPGGGCHGLGASAVG